MGKPSRKRRNPLIMARRQLVPHTAEWFVELERIDPRKAALTRAVLHRARRLDSCSICGDTPAPIHDACDAPWLPLRLCADCVEIRAKYLAEQYVSRLTTPGGQ